MHCGLQYQEVIEKSQLNKSFEMSLANLSCLVLDTCFQANFLKREEEDERYAIIYQMKIAK